MSPTSSGGPGPSPPDPTYRRLSPYRAEVVYAQATYSISTMFQLRVLSGGRALAMTNLRIGVTRKLIMGLILAESLLAYVFLVPN